MRQVNFNRALILVTVLSIMTVILNSKFVIMLEYQITKMTWLKGTTTNWSEGDFVIKKVKQYSVMDINDLNGEKIIGTF